MSSRKQFQQHPRLRIAVRIFGCERTLDANSIVRIEPYGDDGSECRLTLNTDESLVIEEPQALFMHRLQSLRMIGDASFFS